MVQGGRNQTKHRKQSANRGLLQRWTKIDHRRVKRLSLPFGLVVTFRRFKTKKEHRSRLLKQYVYQFRLFSYKEVAVATHRKRREHNPTLLWLPHGVAKALMIGVTITSIIALIVAQGNKTNANPAVNQTPAPVHVVYQNTPTSITMPRSKPVRLLIPDVGIDTNLITLGRQADGTLELPERFDVAGWYKYSPTPGELGPSVIVGHVDSYKGIAVFWNLRLLKPKQIIEVYRADGSVAKFSVTRVKEVSQSHFPTEEVYGNIDYAGIRLITCGGQFIKESHRYNHNIVVFGKLVPPA